MQRRPFQRGVFLTVTKIVCLLGFTYGVIVQIALQEKSLPASIIMAVSMALLFVLRFSQASDRKSKFEPMLQSVEYRRSSGERPPFLAFLFGRLRIGVVALFTGIGLFVALNARKTEPSILCVVTFGTLFLAIAVFWWIYRKTYPLK